MVCSHCEATTTNNNKKANNKNMERTKINDLLRRTDFGATVCVKGWVRTRRGSKSVNFIALNDGSTIKNVQVVADVEKFDADMLKLITTGACLSVEGVLVESQGAGQAAEIQATTIEVLGECGSDFPMQKKGQTFEYMRQHAHLRLRTNSSASATTWPWPCTTTSTSTASSISTRPSSLPATAKAPVRCSKSPRKTSTT